ncbi:hypothetical protein PILCRDRAFT_615179 [Piloderma croceum F 1598]|uniref:FAD-binding PCMH-type domain-containing protein n=1 Tax=Piloderma croceum (strain F 1598) TaxID=765440 RepID=A0A0C3AUM7_PILCF|nr:hypothetical protein PILCRDRAFT_615179 [Piloderma croceum F 1598]
MARDRCLFVFACGLLVASSITIVHATSPSNSSKNACQLLAQSLGSKVQSDGAQYNTSAQGAWNFFNQLDRPTCIVFPQNASDVSVAMEAIYNSDSHYAVRGGGHSAMPGWNTIQDGVLIDFSLMKSFSYDAEQDSISIEPGVLWNEVYDGLQSQGVSPVGGRETGVGVSGLLLGGGLSYLSSAHGFACDNYRAIDVVLPSGELVTATRTNQYSDLLRALKGGGSRFGIATRFEVNAIHTGTSADKIWFGGSVIYPNSSSSEMLKALDNFIYSNRDSKAVILMGFSYENVAGAISTLAYATPFYNGTWAEFNRTFAEFLAIPAITTTLGPLSYNDITKILPPDAAESEGHLYGASSLYPSQGLFEEAFIHWSNFSAQSQIDISNANGGTAFSPPNGAYAAVQLAKDFFVGVTSVSPELRDGIKLLFSQIPRSPGLPLYLNESDETQDALKTYNWYQQLKKVYEKYDPTRFNVRRLFGPNGL